MDNVEKKVIDYKVVKPTFKQRLANAWEKTKEVTSNAAKWCVDHPQETLAIATVVATGAYEGFKICNKQYNIHQTQMLKDRYIYDRSNGHYFKMNRVPTTQQWLEIESRKKDGETLGQILLDMRLL